jgi:signal transduction histidine kinase
VIVPRPLRVRTATEWLARFLQGDLNGARSEEELRTFASAVVHELRTPLTALTGEAELALRRERTAQEYRDAIARIADRAAELAELTADLALLGAPGSGGAPGDVTPLDRLLAQVAVECSGEGNAVSVEVPVPGELDIAVSGNETLLARALTLMVRHAARHCSPTARVLLRLAREPASSAEAGWCTLMLDAAPGGFRPDSCLPLALTNRPGHETARHFRLRIAARVINEAGGACELAPREPPGVDIRLRRAAPFVREK